MENILYSQDNNYRGIKMNRITMTSQYREMIAKKYYSYLRTARDEGGYKVYIPPLYTKTERRMIPDFVEALVKSRDTIEKLNLDPILYYRAQLRAFEQRQRKRGTMLYPNFLWGNGAVKRVQRWMADSKERYGTMNIASVPDTRKDVERMLNESKLKADQSTYESILERCHGNELTALCLSASVCTVEFLSKKIMSYNKEFRRDFIEFIKVQDPIKYEQIESILTN